MKKLLIFSLSIVMLLLAVGCGASASTPASTPASSAPASMPVETSSMVPSIAGSMGQNFEVTVNGEKLSVKSNTMDESGMGLPVKAVAEKLGLTVTVTEEPKLVIELADNRVMEIDYTEGKVLIDGKEHKLEMPALITEDDIFISAPELAVLLGFEYEIVDEVVVIVSKPVN